MELEDTYGIAMSEEEAAKIQTVGQAVDFVFERLPRRPAEGLAEAREPERTAPGGGSGDALVSLIESLSEADREQAVTHSSWTARRVDSWGRAAFLGDCGPRPRRRRGALPALPALRHRPADEGPRPGGQRPRLRRGRARARRAGDARRAPRRRPRRRDLGRGAARQRAGDGVDRRGADRARLPRLRPRADRRRPCSPPSSPRSASRARRCSTSSRPCRSCSRGAASSSPTWSPASPARRTSRRFKVEARVAGEVLGAGTGPSKKAAEQAAAADALAALKS